MKNEQDCLHFFLEQQNKIIEFYLKEVSLSEKRNQAEIFYLRKKNLLSFEHQIESFFSHEENSKIKKNQMIIPNVVLDQSFCDLFRVSQNFESSPLLNEIYCLFSSPIDFSWKNKIAMKSENSFVFRTGFFNHEYAIYDSILLGFDGLFVYTKNLDHFKIQYLLEVGRDFHFPLIFIVQTKKELQTVLETDAPYFVISGYASLNSRKDLALLCQLSNLIPQNSYLMAFCGHLEKKEKNLLHALGYYIIFQCCFFSKNQQF
jgi:hypothetical protein